MTTTRQDFRTAYATMRKLVRSKRWVDFLTLPPIRPQAWDAAGRAVAILADETHGVLRWTDAGRADAAMIRGHRYRLTFGPHRPRKPLP